MSAEPKIVSLDPTKISAETLLAQLAEWEGIEALVAVIRVDGRWQTCWSSGASLGGLSMAAMKLSADITAELQRSADTPHPGWTPPEAS